MVDTLGEVEETAGIQRARRGDGLLLRGLLRDPRAEALGYAAGVSCHGTQRLDYIKELDGSQQPVSIIWGDQDHAAPRRCRRLIARCPRA